MKYITNNTLNKLYHYLSGCDNFTFLDTSKPDERNTSSMLFVDPVKRLQFHEGEDEVEFLDTVQKLKDEGNYIAGWFSYEFGYLLESSLKKRLQRNSDKAILLADLGVFKRCYRFDHVTGETDFPIEKLHDSDKAEREQGMVHNLRFSQERQEYVQAIKDILQYINSGDTYQVNYTLKLYFDFVGSPEKFYHDLRRNQSVSYGAYIRWKDQRVMSFSPELFFWKNNTEIMVRPMKGTLKRGRTESEDVKSRLFLQNDVKNQSENVMIVDLLRNDLGRLMHHITEGDVQVDSLFDVETYETLLQMTSTITGRTRQDGLADVSLYDFFKAIYPCGSVTGAPKIRTMEIIDELETGRRGIYTGAIGYMAPDGDAVFNVPIRTIVLNGQNGEMGIGSGIVHDSVPEEEWRECLLKGRFLTNPQKKFSIVETLLWRKEDGYWLLDDHLKRIETSAHYFLFCCDVKAIRLKLSKLAEEFEIGPRRIRLLLEKDGQFTLSHSACAEPQSLILDTNPNITQSELSRVGVSTKQTEAGSLWFFHKTTNRDLYTEELDKAQSQGQVDRLFTNEDGYVTEGCISNIMIYKDGMYFTPPVDDGLLAGVMRGYLLENFKSILQVKSLRRRDLDDADALFICNSVRGVVQVALE